MKRSADPSGRADPAGRAPQAQAQALRAPRFARPHNATFVDRTYVIIIPRSRSASFADHEVPGFVSIDINSGIPMARLMLPPSEG